MKQLVVSNVTKEFPTPSKPLLILRGINLELDGGENLAVLGPSGSGKSTLLQILGALDNPTQGSVTINGIMLNTLSSDDSAAFRNRHVGFIFQDHHLLPQLTALENVLLPVLANSSVNSTHEAWGRDLLERVGLTSRATHLPRELSGGERQRVAVARALICRPKLILADEPTGSLDQNNAETIGQLLLEMQTVVGATLVCVTHSERLAKMFGRTAELIQGQLES